MTESGISDANYKQTAKAMSIRENKLSLSQQILINQKTDEQSKSLPTLWLIWAVFGMWGGHRFYMHRNCSWLMLGLMIASCLTMIFFIGFIGLLVLFIWKIVDACHLDKWIRFNRLAVRQQAYRDVLHQDDHNAKK